MNYRLVWSEDPDNIIPARKLDIVQVLNGELNETHLTFDQDGRFRGEVKIQPWPPAEKMVITNG